MQGPQPEEYLQRQRLPRKGKPSQLDDLIDHGAGTDDSIDHRTWTEFVLKNAKSQTNSARFNVDQTSMKLHERMRYEDGVTVGLFPT